MLGADSEFGQAMLSYNLAVFFLQQLLKSSIATCGHCWFMKLGRDLLHVL